MKQKITDLHNLAEEIMSDDVSHSLEELRKLRGITTRLHDWLRRVVREDNRLPPAPERKVYGETKR